MADWYDQRLQDGGPVYMETDPGRFIVEPWNAFSSLLMLLPAIYWLWKVRHEYSHYNFLLFSIAMVVLGGLGSAFFHGFRISLVFLLMDVIPSALLTLSLSIYLWLKVLKRWWYIFFILAPVFVFRFLFWRGMPEHMAINVGYFITGLMVALPLLFILYKDSFRHWPTVVIAVASFILALIFRQLDTVSFQILPMGTHFLWHSFSAVGAFFILKYIYYLRDIRIIYRQQNLAI